MNQFINKYHLGVGLLLAILFPGIFIFAGPDNSQILNRFTSSFLCIFSFWIANFTIVDFAYPNGKRSNRFNLFIYERIALSSLCAIVIFLFIGFTIDQTGLLLTQISGEKLYSLRAWTFMIIRVCFFNALFILIKYFYDSNREKQRMQAEVEILKRENILALHESLKQQLNPHFLFNSLNTLKSLVRQGKNQSLVFIDELASVYRYMLSHHGKDEVTIQEEINFLTSYLNLLKLRFGESIVTRMDIPHQYFSFKMPPNTLQLLIENAVKHNVLSQSRPLHISIAVRGDYLIVENNLQIKASEDTSSHVGLSNINSRYKILKGKSIIVEKDEWSFRVLLPITI